jgi:hypothetical protein
MNERVNKDRKGGVYLLCDQGVENENIIFSSFSLLWFVCLVFLEQKVSYATNCTCISLDQHIHT